MVSYPLTSARTATVVERMHTQRNQPCFPRAALAMFSSTNNLKFYTPSTIYSRSSSLCRIHQSETLNRFSCLLAVLALVPHTTLANHCSIYRLHTHPRYRGCFVVVARLPVQKFFFHRSRFCFSSSTVISSLPLSAQAGLSFAETQTNKKRGQKAKNKESRGKRALSS